MSNTHLTETSFDQLGLHSVVTDSLKANGFEQCTMIQALSLPHAVEGKDVAGQAQTGTGKTIAFLAATFHHLLNSKNDLPGPKAIIMAPTRELAVQIQRDAKIFTELSGLRVSAVYGGEGYESQREELNAGTDIIIGTTGRIMDYFKQGVFHLNHIQVVVLDEADRMFDLGFIKDIRYLFQNMPPPSTRVNMLFSATLSMRVQELAYEHMNSPIHVQVEPENVSNMRISEELFYPSDKDKPVLLLTLMEEEWPDKSIVFANTKHECENISNWLKTDGHRVGLLSGDVPQKRRLSILEAFSKGDLDILVATDVAARGLHIDKVTHVFNYDLPDDCEDYVHRIGRTGRAGQTGQAISFACERYSPNLTAIESYIGHQIPVTDYNPNHLLDDVKRPRKPQRRKRPQQSGQGGNQNNRGKRRSNHSSRSGATNNQAQ